MNLEIIIYAVKKEDRKINAVELWFYQRLLRIQWTDKRTNESVLEELSVKPELTSTIERRKLRYLGHAKTNLMTTVLQGKIETKGTEEDHQSRT